MLENSKSGQYPLLSSLQGQKCFKLYLGVEKGSDSYTKLDIPWIFSKPLRVISHH